MATEVLKKAYPYYLANQPVQANTDLEVTDKFSGETATRVALAENSVIDEAIARAMAAEEAMASLPAWKRQKVLNHCAERFSERADELAVSLCIEAGKPIKDSRGEVTRLIDTFRCAAEESVRMTGEVLPLDRTERSQNYQGFWRRTPLGACSFISPFNFPLNLAAHKVAPAIAVGAPFVLKPASRTPIGALIIAETLAELDDLPEGAFSILPSTRDHADRLVTDDRLKMLSFTGSDTVGWDMKARAGKKKVVLELGGNAACVVDEDADLNDAVERMIVGAFYQSGQSCISVQRVLVHEKVYDAFKEKFVKAAQVLKAGNPRDDDTFIGPMISSSAADKVEDWVSQAVDAGAKVLCGARRDGVMYEATVLEGVPKDQTIYNEEVFGPVALLDRFSDFEAALDEVNNSRFGLQAGVFTRDLYKALRAWERLKVGGVIVGDVPSWRVDHMPYGGAKDSGHEREGLRWSMQDMTEVRLLAVRTP